MQLVIIIYISSFNPCYLGNTIRSKTLRSIAEKSGMFQSLLSWKYNQIALKKKSVGIFPTKFQSLLSWKYNQIRRSDGLLSTDAAFQSLLSWKYNQIARNFATNQFDLLFQSLLSWKYNQISDFLCFYTSRFFVSILVILEIQSDLRWWLT